MVMKKPTKFWQDYYGSLEGATILKFNGMNVDEDDYLSFPSFLVKFKDNSISSIEISQDEEGNGGGFIFGLALPQKAEETVNA